MKKILIEVNGTMYNVEISEQSVSETPPTDCLLLHGFTGSTRTWNPFLPAFQSLGRTIAVDLLGHGQSDAPLDSDRYKMDSCVKDLLSMMEQLKLSRTHLLGYSMGGRVALHLAAAAPQRVTSLILESASPGILDEQQRKERAKQDQQLASTIEREGIEGFIDRWEANPLFASQINLPQEVRDHLRNQRLRNRAQGLAGSLRGLGTGMQLPLHHRLQEIQIPTLIIVGALDQKFRSIAQEMGQQMPCAIVKVVPGTGHAVHLEQPEIFQEEIMNFIKKQSIKQ